MCEGPIRVEQILAGRNRRFWELSFFLIFFGIQTSGWIFGGSIDWRPIPLISAKPPNLVHFEQEQSRHATQSNLLSQKEHFAAPCILLDRHFLVDFKKSPNPPWKHLRLQIRDRERGWINYSKHWFQTQPCFSCFLFFVLRTAKWWRTVSLWLQTSAIQGLTQWQEALN